MTDDDRLRHGRRGFLATGAALGVSALAGCNGILGGDQARGGGGGGGEAVGQIGSGRSPFGERDLSAGVSMGEMPDLSGELTVYSGRGEALVGELIGFISDLYPDLDLGVRYGGSTELVNQILTEGESSRADVFYSVNAGSLGALADRDRTTALPSEVTGFVPDAFQDADSQWTGTSGRARTIPYNTDELAASDVPDDILELPDWEHAGDMGWAPTYGSFQAFITAMRILNDDETARQWLEGMREAGVSGFSDEFLVSQTVADGDILAGFANHYYILRVLDGRPDAPIDLAFTEGDAGSVFNVAGACVVDTAADDTLAANFVRHLLSAEAQDYFARTTFEYPLVPDVDPIGRLPPIDELSPPEGLDLSQLSDLQPTIDIMRESGLNV